MAEQSGFDSLVALMFYVYVLKSKKDEKLYFGYTKDLRNRFLQHNKGLVESTKNRRPFDLVYYEAYMNREDATEREKSFKKSGSVYNGLIKRISKSLKS
ncbi:MAG: GIY-YIG nuclease family protein [Nitrosarchaeum sp.]|nr:GIY-YIG nuclease family protein [Nitrosarchaeum sp.]